MPHSEKNYNNLTQDMLLIYSRLLDYFPVLCYIHENRVFYPIICIIFLLYVKIFFNLLLKICDSVCGNFIKELELNHESMTKKKG